MNSEKPAYPRAGYELTNLADNQKYYHEEGLTKRELFAMAAMQGICSNLDHISKTYQKTPEHELIATKAIRIADQTLKQLALTDGATK